MHPKLELMAFFKCYFEFMYKIIMTLCIISFMYIGTYARSRFCHLIFKKHLAVHYIMQVDCLHR